MWVGKIFVDLGILFYGVWIIIIGEWVEDLFIIVIVDWCVFNNEL